MPFKVRGVEAATLLLVALSSSVARGDTTADLAKMRTQFDALSDANKTAAAEAVGKKALALAEKTKDPRDIITWLDLLTALYRAAGRYGDAEPYSKRTLELEGKYSGTDHLNYAYALTHRANLLADQSKYPEAESLFKAHWPSARSNLERTPMKSPQHSIIWRPSTRTKPNMTKRSRSTNGRWRSGRNRPQPTIPK